MPKKSDSSNNRKSLLKQVIKQLHDGVPLEQVKKQFTALLNSCTPLEIAQAEEELIKDGLPATEIQKLCNLHLDAFKQSLEKTELSLPFDHPLHILMEEHKLLLSFAQDLHQLTKSLSSFANLEAAQKIVTQILAVIQNFRDSESHYLREENVLFSYLEKHGITQPPAIMWSEHDRIREIEKSLYSLIDNRATTSFSQFSIQLGKNALVLAEFLASHFQKENNILFPAATRVIGVEEWTQIRLEFDNIGYCSFTPKLVALMESDRIQERKAVQVNGLIELETGTFTPQMLEAVLNALPVDITFVNKDDAVQYFSQSKDRIFVRTKAVVGRKVQACHPQKSLHRVQQIIDDFRARKRDVAEFWINLKNRLIYIRYFPVRNAAGDYLGCLEVTQDITDIQTLKGEKRLLD